MFMNGRASIIMDGRTKTNHAQLTFENSHHILCMSIPLLRAKASGYDVTSYCIRAFIFGATHAVNVMIVIVNDRA